MFAVRGTVPRNKEKRAVRKNRAYAPEQLFRVTDKNSRRVYQLLSFIDRILSGFNGSGKG